VVIRTLRFAPRRAAPHTNDGAQIRPVFGLGAADGFHTQADKPTRATPTRLVPRVSPRQEHIFNGR
jgi:hypothetical protein